MSLSTNSIITNMLATNSARQLGIVTDRKAKSTEKLSSGYKINRAADDAAGLAISEKMRRQIRGLNQGTQNLQDGVSFCQVADGALNEVHDMLQRMEELSVKAANGTLSDQDRENVDQEIVQLMEEMDDIFLNTQFNEKYIWRVPYQPSVTGRPNDIQIYNSPTGTPAGVLIENVRFTWNELGFGFNEDGTFADNSADISSRIPSGSECKLETVSGAAPNDVGRIYAWKANDSGISVNGEQVYSWQPNPDGGYGGVHSFDYHGMHISFYAEDDELDKIIAGINTDDLSGISWKSAIPTSSVKPAVTFDAGNQVTGGVGISQANKNYTHDNREPGYAIRADESGVWIHDNSTGVDTQKTLWSSFSDNGSYPFSDWGRPFDAGDPITLSSQGNYNYTQALQNGYVVSLDFTVMDEVSQQAVIDTFNGITIGTHNNNTEVGATATSSHPEACSGRGSLNAELTQQMKNMRYTSSVNNSYQLRTVDNGDGSTTDKNEGAVSIKLGDTIFSGNYSVDSDKEKTDLVLYQNGNMSLDNKIEVKDFYYQVKGQVGTFETNGSGDVNGVISRRDYSASVSLDFLFQRDHGRNFDRTSDIFNTNSTPISVSQNADGSGTVSLMVGDTVFSGNYASANSDDRVNVTLYPDGVASSNKIKLTDFDVNNPYQYLSINGKNVSQTLTTHMPTYGDVATSFGVVMRPVEKHLILQASGRVDDEIEIRWNSLTSSAIGIGGASARSQDAAMSTINQVRYAQRFISGERIKFGAAQNRVEHAMSQNRNTAENTTAAESMIRDTDMAKEMVQNAKDNILQQAGQTMLAQANQSRQGLLQLLG